MSGESVINVVIELNCKPQSESTVRIYATEKSQDLAVQVAKEYDFYCAEQMTWGKSAYRKCDSVNEAVRLAAEVYRVLKEAEPRVSLSAIQ